MSKHAIDLTQFDDDYRSEQPEDRGDFESVPDGKYQVTVEKVELNVPLDDSLFSMPAGKPETKAPTPGK